MMMKPPETIYYENLQRIRCMGKNFSNNSIKFHIFFEGIGLGRTLPWKNRLEEAFKLRFLHGFLIKYINQPKT